MPQLRLTQKLAKDLHVSKLQEPQEIVSIFDDWVVDVIRVQRKKVAMMTHVKSYLPFFISYQIIGGAQNIASALGKLLSDWVIRNGEAHCCEATARLFSEPVTFCKTVDRKVLGHMNDYRRCAPFVWQNVKFENIDWEEQTKKLEDMPLFMKHESVKYPTPGSLMLDLIERDK